MLIRRAFYYWQFVAALAVPAWLLVGWSVFGSNGWQLLGLLITCPILCAVMFAVSGLISARRSVRASRSVSWLDVGILAAWHATLILAGLFSPATNLLMVLAVLVAIAAFWIVLWELVKELRGNVERLMAPGTEPPAPPSFDPSKPQSGQTYRIG